MAGVADMGPTNVWPSNSTVAPDGVESIRIVPVVGGCCFGVNVACTCLVLPAVTGTSCDHFSYPARESSTVWPPGTSSCNVSGVLRSIPQHCPSKQIEAPVGMEVINIAPVGVGVGVGLGINCACTSVV